MIPHGPRGEAVSAALEQIGTPYSYGGSQPGAALDCSGLTLVAYRAAGLRIPRSAKRQLSSARHVVASRLEPGDLVFFRIGKGYHVGLVVASDRFVHASTSAGRVQMARIDTPYWRNRLVGGGSYFK